jgi:hypothetical protein
MADQEIIIQEGGIASGSEDASCITYADVLAFKLNCQTIELCCDNATIQARVDRMTELVNAATGVDWCPEDICFEFSGTGKSKLFFTPITSKYLNELGSVDIIKCGTGCGQSTEESVDLDTIRNNNYWLEFTCPDCFPCGHNNIRVCGSWGKPMPQAIKQAIIMLTIESLAPGTMGLTNPGGVSRASWEDFSISYRETDNPSQITTGYVEIDNMLQPYVATMSQIKMFVPTNDKCVPRNCGKVGGC